ncbi:hypothetical protein [Halorientalis regularis]|nr:hypothetical protein [Halorientalis regularis]
MSDNNPLKDRFDPIEPDQEEESSASESSQTEETESSDSVDKTDKIDNTSETDETDSGSESAGSSKTDTRRDRPHTAMYISADLVDRMKDRYRKINGELMINDGEEIELNKHFYEGLIKAGLENPDLKDIVLDQRENE